MVDTWVQDFADGTKDAKDLLGGKGANLAEMTRLGLPVPPGFTITTTACRAYLRDGREPDGLAAEVGEHLARLERAVGRRLGDPDDPLLVSVRSGATVSMPGMMDTVLDIGLTDASVAGLASRSGDRRFAWDSYRRLVAMFGDTVLGVDAGLFAVALDGLKERVGATTDAELDAEQLEELVATYLCSVRDRAGRDFPQDPREQLDLAVRAVFRSWNTERARLYRRQQAIPDDLGTAVNVCAMVFGNLGRGSGTGVAFTRDPATGARGVYGDYLENAQGEDVVAGTRNTIPLADLEHVDAASYHELLGHLQLLEKHYRDLCDVEFTIERGRLWMLQVRVGKRTAAAAFRIAVQLVDEGVIDLDEALDRVTGAQLAQLMYPRFADDREADLLATGTGASPGAAVGAVVFSSAEAVARAARGEDVVLVRRETSPDDLPGMVAATGVLTSRGGKTSHAAVVARGMGRACVCGVDTLDVDAEARRLTTAAGSVVVEGEVVSLDGTTGAVFRGSVPVQDAVVVRHFEGEVSGAAEDDVVSAVARIMAHADLRARLSVRANADTAEDAARARRFGARGIGLCRTEHMFLGPRRVLVEHLILAETDDERAAALAALLPVQRADLTDVLAAMDGLPVTIRLLDPPLHEFLPSLTELAVKVAASRAAAAVDERDERLLAAVRRMHEENPMLGLRGVRLGIVVPGLYRMQVRAVLEATVERLAAGGDPRPEIMVPLVATARELALVRADVLDVATEVEAATGVRPQVSVGTMIELPRAALTAGPIAEEADFFSFGTNDLTQMTWGFSRDDVESAFFSTYLARGVFAVSPFETLDADGVGALVEEAVRRGRRARPALHLGVCGEHGGDPASIHFFDRVGLDYVSCSPLRVPVARLEAGRAARARA